METKGTINSFSTFSWQYSHIFSLCAENRDSLLKYRWWCWAITRTASVHLAVIGPTIRNCNYMMKHNTTRWPEIWHLWRLYHINKSFYESTRNTTNHRAVCDLSGQRHQQQWQDPQRLSTEAVRPCSNLSHKPLDETWFRSWPKYIYGQFIL